MSTVASHHSSILSAPRGDALSDLVVVPVETPDGHMVELPISCGTRLSEHFDLWAEANRFDWRPWAESVVSRWGQGDVASAPGPRYSFRLGTASSQSRPPATSVGMVGGIGQRTGPLRVGYGSHRAALFILNFYHVVRVSPDALVFPESSTCPGSVSVLLLEKLLQQATGGNATNLDASCSSSFFSACPDGIDDTDDDVCGSFASCSVVDERDPTDLGSHRPPLTGFSSSCLVLLLEVLELASAIGSDAMLSVGSRLFGRVIMADPVENVGIGGFGLRTQVSALFAAASSPNGAGVPKALTAFVDCILAIRGAFGLEDRERRMGTPIHGNGTRGAEAVAEGAPVGDDDNDDLSARPQVFQEESFRGTGKGESRDASGDELLRTRLTVLISQAVGEGNSDGASAHGHAGSSSNGHGLFSIGAWCLGATNGASFQDASGMNATGIDFTSEAVWEPSEKVTGCCRGCGTAMGYLTRISHCRVCGKGFCRPCVGCSVPREFCRAKRPGEAAQQRGLQGQRVSPSSFVKCCQRCYHVIAPICGQMHMSAIFLRSGLGLLELWALQFASRDAWGVPIARVLREVSRLRSLSPMLHVSAPGLTSSLCASGRVFSLANRPLLRSVLLSSAGAFKGHLQAALVLHKAMASENPQWYYKVPLSHVMGGGGGQGVGGDADADGPMGGSADGSISLAAYCEVRRRADRRGGGGAGLLCDHNIVADATSEETQRYHQLMQVTKGIVETLSGWWGQSKGSSCHSSSHGTISHTHLGCPPSCRPSTILYPFTGLDVLTSMAGAGPTDVPEFSIPGEVSMAGVSEAQRREHEDGARSLGALLKELALEMILGKGWWCHQATEGSSAPTVPLPSLTSSPSYILGNIPIYRAIVPVLVDALASPAARYAAVVALSHLASVPMVTAGAHPPPHPRSDGSHDDPLSSAMRRDGPFNEMSELRLAIGLEVSSRVARSREHHDTLEEVLGVCLRGGDGGGDDLSKSSSSSPLPSSSSALARTMVFLRLLDQLNVQQEDTIAAEVVEWCSRLDLIDGDAVQMMMRCRGPPPSSSSCSSSMALQANGSVNEEGFTLGGSKGRGATTMSAASVKAAFLAINEDEAIRRATQQAAAMAAERCVAGGGDGGDFTCVADSGRARCDVRTAAFSSELGESPSGASFMLSTAVPEHGEGGSGGGGDWAGEDQKKDADATSKRGSGGPAEVMRKMMRGAGSGTSSSIFSSSIDSSSLLVTDLPVRPFPYPFNASVTIVAIRLRGISLKKNAATRPMFMPLVGSDGRVYNIIYKREPMRQDLVTAHINAMLLFLMERGPVGGCCGGGAAAEAVSPSLPSPCSHDEVPQNSDGGGHCSSKAMSRQQQQQCLLTKGIPRYGIVCITPFSGIIEVVPRSRTLQSIWDDYRHSSDGGDARAKGRMMDVIGAGLLKRGTARGGGDAKGGVGCAPPEENTMGAGSIPPSRPEGVFDDDDDDATTALDFYHHQQQGRQMGDHAAAWTYPAAGDPIRDGRGLGEEEEEEEEEGGDREGADDLPPPVGCSAVKPTRRGGGGGGGGGHAASGGEGMGRADSYTSPFPQHEREERRADQSVVNRGGAVTNRMMSMVTMASEGDVITTMGMPHSSSGAASVSTSNYSSSSPRMVMVAHYGGGDAGVGDVDGDDDGGTAPPPPLPLLSRGEEGEEAWLLHAADDGQTASSLAHHHQYLVEASEGGAFPNPPPLPIHCPVRSRSEKKGHHHHQEEEGGRKKAVVDTQGGGGGGAVAGAVSGDRSKRPTAMKKGDVDANRSFAASLPLSPSSGTRGRTMKRRGPLLAFYLDHICGGDIAAATTTSSAAVGEEEGSSNAPSSSSSQTRVPLTQKEAGRRFLYSAQYFLVFNYWLAVSDRHRDNVMITDDGYAFHIDFGFMLGESPSHEVFTARMVNRESAHSAQFVRFDADFRECVVYFVNLLYKTVEGDDEAPAPDDGITDEEALSFFIDETASLFIALRPYSHSILMLLQHLVRHTFPPTIAAAAPPPPHPSSASSSSATVSPTARHPLSSSSAAITTAASAIATSVGSATVAALSSAATATRRGAGGLASAAGWALRTATGDRGGGAAAASSGSGSAHPLHNQRAAVGASSNSSGSCGDAPSSSPSAAADESLERRSELFLDHSLEGRGDAEAREVFTQRMRESLVSSSGTLRDWAHSSKAAYKRLGKLFEM